MQKLKLPTVSGMASAGVHHRLAVAAKFSTILVAVLALYLQDLSIVFTGALSDEASFHILAIPFLFAYLLFRKRKMVSAAILQPQSKENNAFLKYFNELVGILLCATAILAYWYGSYVFTPLEYHMLTLPVLVAGLTMLLFGAQTLKQLIFPIIFLFFLTPPPTEILYSVGSLLSNLSAEASNALANVFGLGSTLSSNYGNPLIAITRPDHTIMNFSVDVACSGVYSLIGFTIFAVFIAYITQGKIRNKFAILVMGIPLIIALNIIRITTIITIGYYYGDQLALQVFHTLGATVLMFIGTLILLAITAKAFKKPKPPEPCQTCNQNQPTLKQVVCSNCGKLLQYPKIKLRKSDFAKIAGIAAVVVFLLSIQTPVFALTQGPAQVIIQTPSGTTQGNTQILPQIQGYNLTFLYRDTAFEQLSGEDASLAYVYNSPNGVKPTVFIAVEYAEAIGVLHRWETCLVNAPIAQGNQPAVTELDLRDIQLQENPPITARFFAFQDHKSNQTQVVLYWYETATLDINGTTQQKHVKMSVIMYPQSPENVSETESQLLPIATAISNYWQPIKTWTTIALMLSQNGLVLSVATSTLLVALIFYWALLNRQEKLLLLKLYEKLSKQIQLLVKAVNNAEKMGKPTTLEIANELQKLTGTSNSENLAEKLQEAENVGLIEEKIVNLDDSPAIHWKSRLPPKSSLLKRLRL
jgi:exosortase